MFQKIESIGDRKVHHRLTDDEAPLTVERVLELWETEPIFLRFFLHRLAESTFRSYFWETPPITRQTLDPEFEFVLVDSPGLAQSAPDETAFQSYFRNSDAVGTPEHRG